MAPEVQYFTFYFIRNYKMAPSAGVFVPAKPFQTSII